MQFPDCLALYDQSDEEQYKVGSFHNTDGFGVPIDRATEWKNLPTTKKVHRRRNAINRHFDGTPERRTRDYHLYDSKDNEYGIPGGGRRDCVIS